MLNEIIKDFQKAVKKLEEVLKLEKTEIIRDSVIKGFEFCLFLIQREQLLKLKLTD